MRTACGIPHGERGRKLRVARDVFTLALATVACGPSAPASPPRPRAVVLVTIDTLRADGVTFLGGSPPTTPFLDSLAAEGIVFTRAYSTSSWTAPAMASLFTGLEPASHGVVSGFVRKGDPGTDAGLTVANQPLLPHSLTTLAECFQAAGYVTVGVPSNLHLSRRLGFGQGFDHYYGDARFLDAPDVNDRVRAQLEAAFGPHWKSAWKRERTFLWIHYFDPHVPYFARAPWIEEYAPDFATDPTPYPAGWDLPRLQRRFPRPGPDVARRLAPLYRSEIRFVDEHLRALDEELGLGDDDVLLLLTSDHGEEFGEHGKLGHGQTLYEEAVHVPLLVHWPAGLHGSRRIDDPASLLDVLPSFAALLGLPLPPGLQGRPLRGLGLPDPGPDRPLYLETDRAHPLLHAVRDGSWKLIEPAGRPPRLFDLTGDPAETRDVADRRPDVVGRLRDALSRHLASLPPPPDDTGLVPVSNQEDAEKLRGLGYGD